MKHKTSTPDYTIKQVAEDCFKVFDRNQHFRRSFGTRQGADAWINEQRTGKRVRPATTEMTQAAHAA